MRGDRVIPVLNTSFSGYNPSSSSIAYVFQYLDDGLRIHVLYFVAEIFLPQAASSLECATPKFD